jgi:hypothetical protein
LGIGLGAAFFYAGLQKAWAPYEFAEAILAYQLLPEALVGLTAASLPLLEAAVGGLLVLGYLAETAGRLAGFLGLTSGSGLPGATFRRSSLLLIMAQLVLFMAVLLITLARGLDIDCGCGLLAERQVGLAAILEDALLLMVAGWLYWREFSITPVKVKSLTHVQPEI